MGLAVNLTVVPYDPNSKDYTDPKLSSLPEGLVFENKKKKKANGEQADNGNDSDPPTQANGEKEAAPASAGEAASTDASTPELTEEGKSEPSTAPPTTEDSAGSEAAEPSAESESPEGTDTTPSEDNVPNKKYTMTIDSSGKYSRKAEWQDIANFANLETVDSDTLKEWVRSYLEQTDPEKLTKPRCIPRWTYIKDDFQRGCDAYKSYDWKPVKLNLQPGVIDIKKQYSKDVVLDTFDFDYSIDIDAALEANGDHEVVSYLRKSKLTGHPLAAKMVKAEPQVTTEFRDVESVVFRLGNNHTEATLDEETGDMVWTDRKKLRALLQGTPLPKKTGKGVTRTVEILAVESYIKARVYYKAFFTGSVTTDHGNETFEGQRYWNWDLKYLLRHNNVTNAVVVYQDVEMHFFTKVHLHMENEEWEWITVDGKWVKQRVAQSDAP
eukprot:Nitzschia sp. Nitz4//scaffold47_size129522//93834//95150//NITZ4_003563-RA/size129522-processed-gene-0.50-mRNA-1//-1//CDS//3329552836//6344//frame0